MTSKLRIDLSRKAEPVRFSFPLLLNQLTVMHSFLSFRAENVQVILTSKLRIDLSRKAEPVRFSFPLLLNQLTVMHSFLSFRAENVQVI